MAAKKRQAFEKFLKGFGAAGEFENLIRRAIINGWTKEQFEAALVRTAKFRRMFPGLIGPGGTIADFVRFAGGTDLVSAVIAYEKMVNAYQQHPAFRGLGIALTPGRIKALIRGQISPDEFGARIDAIMKVRENPELRDLFNEQLRAAGKKPLDQMGFFKFVARAAPRTFYDLYEAAQLRAAGLDLGPTVANRLAQQIGAPGAPFNVAEIVQQIRKLQPDIGPELAREGISTADLVLLGAGQDPNNIAPKLQQLIEQRRLLGQPTGFAQGRRGPGGGIAFRPEEAPLAAE